MSGGAVVTTFFSVVTAGSQLGQAAPSIDALARGRGSAFKIFKMIDRKPLIDPSSEEGRTLEKARRAPDTVQSNQLSKPRQDTSPALLLGLCTHPRNAPPARAGDGRG